MPTVVHLWTYPVSLVKVQGIRRKEVLAGGVQGTDYFSSNFSDGSYVQIPLDVWAEFNSLKARSYSGGTTIHHNC